METTKDLASELSQFIGTTRYYKPSIFSSMRITDGVKYFIDNAGNGAYWFTDIVAVSYTHLTLPTIYSV